MGTNFYWVSLNETCKSCGQVARNNEERYHIGKSSGGWTFGFHGTDVIRSFKDWCNVFEFEPGYILDEYDKPISVGGFKNLVEAKKDEKHNHAKEYPENCWLDDEGHGFHDAEFS